MRELEVKSLCILGRQSALSIAELESLYGPEKVAPLPGAAILSIPAEDINFKRLGGVIKVARVLAELSESSWTQLSKYLIEKIPEHLQYLPDGKFTLGISIYGLNVDVKDINRSALEIKKLIKKTGRPVRVVPNKTAALNSAQVLHNKLTHKGAWELIFFRNGDKTILAQTLFVQDIDAYAARDQARPKRDAKVGMLPPKLAQIMINLASGHLPKNVSPARVRLLDPFCGSGVILQEALLMGYSVLGTDIDPRMVDYARVNIQWLAQKYPTANGHVSIEVADATVYRWPRFTTIASELYLGPPLANFPKEAYFKQIIADTNEVAKKFLQNLATATKNERPFCLAVPAWRKPNGNLLHLPLLAKLTDMGYNRVKFKHVHSEDLIYFRENQIVARELLVLKRDK